MFAIAWEAACAAPATHVEGERDFFRPTQPTTEEATRRRSLFFPFLSLSLLSPFSLSLSPTYSLCALHASPFPSHHAHTHTETSQTSAVAGGRRKRRVSFRKGKTRRRLFFTFFRVLLALKGTKSMFFPRSSAFDTLCSSFETLFFFLRSICFHSL